MALHTELPIYRTGVRLLDLAVRAQVQMPRTVKRALGENVYQPHGRTGQTAHARIVEQKMTVQKQMINQKVRQNNEALPNTYNVLKAPKYKPEPVQPVRTGADDHLKCKSKLGA